ncbi:N-acetyl-gamma-glutamyl-phosphate reductase [Sulfodiicoccus acidiphilus]|uniref:[LysW]-L-2-aminoadipate/[LysW]-L-glutamate phosphate reductase n=1 Tax=Sulfodiicoccus acidiphilus TaxID=1670455 RepID=A0A348B2Q3_9CREN|nr:N-acetyl-gamma-glutamyl-phosphate reductase [Sulfodiicoccus acidiphilus]BBD72455.1 N-acetyl-gamma-glutamyl-phosphate reductase [Sulfodiicoccus acidiphilus]GGT97020.1 N-acetyl-gamma-glutamyl-phosphate reductase [Sulfodiicoccus acidiphilus]
MIRVAVVGASGYTGGELLRLLAVHPQVEVTVATSREYAGKPVGMVHPNLRGVYSINFTQFTVDKVSEKSDTVFLALPHGVSMNYVPELLQVGVQVVDLSADYRLKDPSLYKTWYGVEHPHPDLLGRAVYGLPELHGEELKGSKLIASPGCNATATILALAPVVGWEPLGNSFLSDVKVGSSEGGAKPSEGSHHPERQNAIRPYEAEGHRHEAEAEQELSRLSRGQVRVSIIPHAVSSVRGVLASAHAWSSSDVEETEMWRRFAEFYRGKSFIRIVRRGIHPYPDPKYVIGSNFADLGFAVDRRVRRVTTFAAIDNMMKGAAGQAVQAFNVSRGFQENEGLRIPPMRPV